MEKCLPLQCSCRLALHGGAAIETLRSSVDTATGRSYPPPKAGSPTSSDSADTQKLALGHSSVLNLQYGLK
jgi:hypothetical protein